MKRFTEEHEWIDLDGEEATIGITTHAAAELGDITFVEMPELNVHISQGDVLTVVESVKAASDVYCPVSGNVCGVNTKLEDKPEILNDSPEAEGWICKLNQVKEDELKPLMTEAEYIEFID